MLTKLVNSLLHLKQKMWLLPHKARSRRVINQFIQENPKKVRVNLGSGYKLMNGWLNADNWPYAGTVYIDVSQRLPFGDGEVELIKCEHLIEHLEYRVCRDLFRESYRVLQKGGILRLSTPDLAKLIKLYSDKTEPTPETLLEHHCTYHNRTANTMCAWFNDHMRLWGHQFIFDEPTLLSLLKESGFTRVQSYRYGESQNPHLKNVEIHDEGVEWMQWAYIMIFEAHKCE